MRPVIQNENIIQDFIDVTEEVMSTMASVTIKTKAIQEINGTGESNDITSCLDITGILGFSGGRRGSLLVSLTQATALGAVGGMLGVEFSTVDSDVRDGVGELVNMIAGGAKTRLQSRGIDFSLSIPNTIIGPDHQITAANATNRTRIDFNSNLGDFFIEIYLKEDNEIR